MFNFFRLLIYFGVNTENCTEYCEKNAFLGPIFVPLSCCKEEIFWRNVRGNVLILVLFSIFFKVQISFQSKYIIWQVNAFCEDVYILFAY